MRLVLGMTIKCTATCYRSSSTSCAMFQNLDSVPGAFRYLKLEMHISKWDLPGIAKLLESAPCLEKLDICTESPYPRKFNFGGDFLHTYNFNADDYLASGERFPKCLLLNLRNIEIFRFPKMLFQFELAKFLLANAPVLEKMVIYFPISDGVNCINDCCKAQKILPDGQHLLLLPRSSPDAKVEFSNSRKNCWWRWSE